MAGAEKKEAREEGESKMKIHVVKETDSEMVAVADGVTPSFMNALRRAAVYEVPTLAIEDVYFSKNSSALYDEIIANRLGLIPLKTDLKAYVLPAECTCGGKLCAKCSSKLTLNVKGPATVYAKDLKFKDPTIKPIYPATPIVKLLENQELKFEAVVVLGRGEEHIKWSPCHFYYQHYPAVNINHSEIKKPQEVADRYPKFLEVHAGRLALKNLGEDELAEFCRMCSEEAIEIKGEPNKFIFTLESWEQLPIRKILFEATKVMEKKLKEVRLR